MNDQTTRVEARRGFFPVVLGDEVSVAQAGGRLFVSRGDIHLSQGGAQRMVARGDVTINQGGAQMLLTGGDVSIREGGAMIAVAANVQARSSYVGLAIGRDVEISDDSTLLFGPRQAAVFGAVAGLVCGVVASVLRRRHR
jgi:hypothetical protein